MSLFALTLWGCGGLDAFHAAQPSRLEATILGRERDPVGAILARTADLPPDVEQYKLCRMAEGPFPFYRATAHLYYDDLFGLPERQSFAGPVTWLSGDAHPHNLGAFDDDEGQVVFDLNDFDESFIGDAQLDLWRLAAGAALLAEEVGLDEDDRRDALEALIDGWIEAVEDAAEGDDEEDFRFTSDSSWGKLDDFLEEVEDDNSRRRMLAKWTDDELLDLERTGVEPIGTGLEAALVDAWPAYVGSLQTGLAGEHDWFTLKDVQLRVGAGLGSLGTPRLVALIEGPSDDDDDDRILDIKRQGEPSVWPYLDAETRELVGAPAERILSGSSALLAEADDHLGTLYFDGGEWTVRERSPYKETLANEWIDSKRRFRKVAEQWGYALATAQARADVDAPYGVDQDWDAAMAELLDADENGFRTLALEVGLGYAEVVRADHRSFVDRVRCPN